MNKKESIEKIINHVNQKIDEGLSVKREILEVSNLSKNAKVFISLAETLIGKDNFDEINSKLLNNKEMYNQKLRSIRKIM